MVQKTQIPYVFSNTDYSVAFTEVVVDSFQQHQRNGESYVLFCNVPPLLGRAFGLSVGEVAASLNLIKKKKKELSGAREVHMSASSGRV